jgi:Pretoxin HINT domain
MPRSTDSILNNLLPACETQTTLELAFSDRTVRRWISYEADFQVVGGNTFIGHLDNSDELAQTIESPSDLVSVSIQNVDTNLGKLVAGDLRKFMLAEAKLGRVFRGIRDKSIVQHRPIFAGLVTAISGDMKQIKFDLQPDYIALGLVVADGTLAPSCVNVFGDINCGYSGSLTTCNQQLKSSDGCAGRKRKHRFRGFTFSDLPQPSPGGGDGGIGGGIDPETCFLAGTIVAAPNGYKPIETLKTRDKVLCFDEKTGTFKTSVVTNTFEHQTNFYYRLVFDDGTVLEVTPEHRIFTKNGWKTVDNLAINDWVSGKHSGIGLGEFVKQSKLIQIQTKLEPVKVYNIEVAEFHTYFANGIIVHNAKDYIVF